MKRKIVILTMLAAMPLAAGAQEVLSLSQCRQRALEANHGLKQAEERTAETAALEKAALWQMLPKISANGTYTWMDKSVSLLSDEQEARLQNLGPTLRDGLVDAVRNDFGNDIPFGSEWIVNQLTNFLSGSSFESTINGFGQQLVDALTVDTRNTVAGLATVTQPVFMGGKLVALHRSAELMHHLSGIQYDKQREELLIGVDEAYWQVVSVKHKKELAEQYARLLDTLNANVEEMVEAEVATKGDLTKVRVKRNEAQMSLTKATNGLALAKMLLAQRCGMPLDSDFDVQSIDPNVPLTLTEPDIVLHRALHRRNEMKMLAISDSIAQQGVRIARSTLLPNIAVSGGYLVSNPNVFNGFEKELNGTFVASVVVNVPLFHPGGYYSLKAAKHRRQEVAYQMAEAREMIELQINKLDFELQLAYKKLAQAQSNLANAEENLKLADESFKAGMASSSDLMAAQTAWIQAKGDILDARIEIEMDRLYLLQALGENEK